MTKSKSKTFLEGELASVRSSARIEPVTETFFGTSVTDDFRWMENESDTDTSPYIEGETAYARRVLDAIPKRAKLESRIRDLSGSFVAVGGVQIAGPYLFVEKRPTGANGFGLYVCEESGGQERALIVPEERSLGNVYHAMNYWLASPNGRFVLVGLSAAGSEQVTIELVETATGRILADRIDRVPYAWPSWLEDESGFFFNRLAEASTVGSVDYYKNSACWLHRIGTDAEDDMNVLSQGRSKDVSMSEIDFPAVVVQPRCDVAVAMLVSGSRRELTLFVSPLDAVLRGDARWRQVCTSQDLVTSFAMRGKDLWLLTEKDASHGRVVRVKASVPEFANATEVVPQSDALLRSLHCAQDALYVCEARSGISGVRRLVCGSSERIEHVRLPFPGSLTHVFSDPRRDGVVAIAESWVKPQTIIEVPLSREIFTTERANATKSLFEHLASEELFATSYDGTRIPVSLVYKEGTQKNGNAPTILEAYGAYGVSSDPRFAPRFIAWIERGGIWATAHVRGGGEHGREWHEAGHLLNKPNSWLDFIAVAEWLVEERWTSPSKLTARGASAGGIVVGRALTERPELFCAAIGHVGLFNPLRAEFTQNGPPNVPEFGSIQTESGFKALHAMDAYMHVRPGVPYPAVYLSAGKNDARVEPYHAAKMAAKLRASTTSRKPVLLWVDPNAGHGQGSTRDQRDRELTDVFAFALWQAGEAL